MYCMCQQCQSIYITSHNASVSTTLAEMRFQWEVSSLWFTGECWEWPTGSLWSNQVQNLESLPSGSATALSSFLKLSTVPSLMVKKPQLRLWETFPFLKGGSLLCHHAHCGGGGQHLPGQPLLLLVCFLCTEENCNLDFHHLLTSPLPCPLRAATDDRAQQVHHASHGLWANTQSSIVPWELHEFSIPPQTPAVFPSAISHHNNYIPRAAEMFD